jgi:hypothetical protein
VYTAYCRLAAKKVTDAQDKISTLKAELKKTKEPAEEEKKRGPISTFSTTWLHKKAVTSKVYHGGDWEGNSCRRFLLEGATPVYKEYIDALVEKIEEIVTTTSAQSNKVQKLTEFLNGTFKTLCDKLAPVVKAISSTKAFNDNQIDNTSACCREYVSYYRNMLSSIRKVIGDGVNAKPKLHVLETHVPGWLKEWRSVGFFGEDVVESLHAVINGFQRRFSVDWARNKIQYMQSVDDELNLLFDQFANEKDEASNKKQSKKRKRPPEGPTDTPPDRSERRNLIVIP